MGKRDKRVDAYIAKSADFAKPILTHLRALVHAACPNVEENIKWGVPAFEYKGPMCGMAAFKQHCTFGFWKYSLLVDDAAAEDAMGNFGRIASLADLPSDRTLTGYIKKATVLNDNGVKVPRTPTAPKKPVVVPKDFAAALKKSAAAKKHFDAFSPSAKREYVEWVTEAKTDATRQKRLLTSVEWIKEGKSRNWKYMPK
ncbi:MAG TPA: YdeI/OmpD-associated family protein [Vicinamibacterales bacterium]|jgi:uncharacterized protein YdeI (YjbR/CyaY-like superfamily)